MPAELEVSELRRDNGALRQRVAKLERTVAFLLDQLKLTYVDVDNSDPFADVAALLHSGKKIEAVKLYRERTGASLTDAMKFIDSL